VGIESRYNPLVWEVSGYGEEGEVMDKNIIEELKEFF